MNRPWLIGILICSFFLLKELKIQEVNSLTVYFRGEKVLRLHHFDKVKTGQSPQDVELIELWESMLTGRVAPLSKWIKERYKHLGLNHLFTPSGFHLSAVLAPIFLLLKSSRFQLGLLALITLSLSFMTGQGALKRMVLIKLNQKLLGQHLGFVLALILDILFGTFQNSALSFSYSFLFLGIIYSGAKGFSLVIWIFFAQIMLAHFQGNDISPLLLILSPFLNLGFGLAMPLLLLLAFPLWHWQLEAGLTILRTLQWLVDGSAHLLTFSPLLEAHLGLLLILLLFSFKRWKSTVLMVLLLSNSLNLDSSKNPGIGRYDFRPTGQVSKIINSPEQDLVYFSDGKCKRKLVRGFWWENCSPKRGSSHRKIKKLLHLSSKQRKSSLRG